MAKATGSDEQDSVKWLTAEELDAWLSVIRLMIWLPWSIDQQLQRDSDLAMVEYQVLAMLSESPERTMRLSSLAEVTNAVLTEDGFQTLVAAAPGHVAHVRSLVIDVLSPEHLRRLGRDAQRITSRIDTSAIN